MKWIFTILSVLVLAVQTDAGAADRPLTVVELYTSQGCSSCPPADALAGELTKHADVLPLSLHVDYWDYIGWKDPFARAEHTERQRAYSRRFNLRYVYTPQMVINGAFQSSGAKRSDVYSFIEQAKAEPHVAMKLIRSGSHLQVALPDGAVNGEVEVISIFADRRHDTKIKEGENGGRTLSYYNVVRDMRSIGIWHGKAAKIAVTMSEISGDLCAVILQETKTRRIIGAVQIALDGS